MKKLRNKEAVMIARFNNFQISQFLSFSPRGGMVLLLVILILSALLSISIGIFNVVLGEFRISGEISDSFIAFYAADQGVEQVFYDDRVAGSLCRGGGTCEYGPVTVALANGSCYTARLSRTGNDTSVTSTGEYRCGGSSLAVKRAFQASYSRVGGRGR